MKVLLDTNIVIHREGEKMQLINIGQLFHWLDKLHLDKFIHPITVRELEKFNNASAVRAMNIKLENYQVLKTQASLSEKVLLVSSQLDTNENDHFDTILLNELYNDRVDILITEDKKVHKKALLLNINNKVFTVSYYLNKLMAENPDLVDYNILSIKKAYFGNINLADPFFDSFREDYKGFDKWFNTKSNEVCYVFQENSLVQAFLYIKVESEGENYSDVMPNFSKRRRLKIGTFKVINNGFRLGERFLKIIFDNAFNYKVEEIYVTIFDKRPEQILLISLLKLWGFQVYGKKKTVNGDEIVLIKPFTKNIEIDLDHPKVSFPFLPRNTKKYIVKIEAQYHTELFPDSILNNESATNYIDNVPHRNSLSKVYISHSKFRDFKSGDILIFYRIGETSPKIYTSTVTTIGIVESVVDNIKSFDELKSLCKKKTVISDAELKQKFWDAKGSYKPFIINFLYAHSLPMPKPTLKDLNKIGVIPDISAIPRGFIEITTSQFNSLIKFAYKS